ncbi:MULTISPECIES: hypothetical protein [unclassified Streptomyces]|nr:MULTISPECIES: hypothetical protein [unclassified Streptomyces]MDF3148031.1 hypothetical protein [Streptomyces sp. T21Q-yed]WDF39314.1 hypothetical protein PBV52_22160 [Streptomyces sp. T12]
MSFHKIAPVKKNCKTAAPAAKKQKASAAPKKAAPKRRPVAHKG